MPNDVHIPFGRNLTRIMRDRNFRIQDVSAKAGLGNSVVHSWMTGTSPYDLRAVKRLADALKVQFSEFLLKEFELKETKIEAIEIGEVLMFEGLCRIRIDRIKTVSKDL